MQPLKRIGGALWAALAALLSPGPTKPLRPRWINKPEWVQRRWNEHLTHRQRAAMFWRFTDRLGRMFDDLGLTCHCPRCWAVMTYEQVQDEDGACIACGCYPVETPYGASVSEEDRHLAGKED